MTADIGEFKPVRSAASTYLPVRTLPAADLTGFGGCLRCYFFSLRVAPHQPRKPKLIRQQQRRRSQQYGIRPLRHCSRRPDTARPLCYRWWWTSAAQPGPICYGRGGTEVTVTDANLLLGRLDPEYFLAGRMRLDPSSVNEAMEALGESMGLGALELAASIVEIANENMASAIKMVSLERGHDPRRFALLAFGGAGPLHAAAVARVLGVPKVIVPQYPGVFSALGLLLADIRVDKVWTQAFRSNDVDAPLVNRQFDRITERAIGELRQEGFAGEPDVQRAINMRYFGQNYEHEVEIEGGELDEAALERAFRSFDALHAERYGYSIDGEVIELVSFKVTVIGGRAPLDLSRADGTAGFPRSARQVYVRGHGFLEAAVVRRSSLEPGEVITGPAVIEEEGSTTYVEPGMAVQRGAQGALLVETGVSG